MLLILTAATAVLLLAGRADMGGRTWGQHLKGYTKGNSNTKSKEVWVSHRHATVRLEWKMGVIMKKWVGVGGGDRGPGGSP
jgi:hypothetical protein